MSHPIFRAGTRRDNNGNLITITEADVAQAAAAYDAEANPAPIVIGHPSTDAPAYGWVAGLKAEGGVLSADFAQLDEGFADLVRRGRYKKVSASFYPPAHPANPTPGRWQLRHVGFLGAAAPAVKGLPPVNFAADSDGIVEFSEPAESRLDRVFRQIGELLEQIRSGKTDDAPPPVVPPQQDGGPSDFSEPETHPEQGDDMTLNAEQQLAAEKAAREKAEADAAQAKAELKKLQDEQEQTLRDAAGKQNADFAEGLVKAGRLKPADKELVVQALNFAEYPQHYTADFGEGGAKKPLSAALRDFLQAVLPATKLNRETATGGAVSFAEGASHHERALAVMEAKGISYEEAARITADY